MIIRCIDFETTGIPSEGEKHGVVEVGSCDVTASIAAGSYVVVENSLSSGLCNPVIPISIGAMATHHIMDSDIVDAPPVSARFIALGLSDPEFFAAHNADFEKEFFGGSGKPFICTWKVALRIFPDMESHGLSYLRYALKLPVDRDKCPLAHRAGADAYVCAHLLARLLNEGVASVEEMARWSKGPALLPRLTFGKYRGEKWDDVPTRYLEWVADQKDMDKNIRANAKHHLKKRATS